MLRLGHPNAALFLVACCNVPEAQTDEDALNAIGYTFWQHLGAFEHRLVAEIDAERDHAVWMSINKNLKATENLRRWLALKRWFHGNDFEEF